MAVPTPWPRFRGCPFAWVAFKSPSKYHLPSSRRLARQTAAWSFRASQTRHGSKRAGQLGKSEALAGSVELSMIVAMGFRRPARSSLKDSFASPPSAQWPFGLLLPRSTPCSDARPGLALAALCTARLAARAKAARRPLTRRKEDF